MITLKAEDGSEDASSVLLDIAMPKEDM